MTSNVTSEREDFTANLHTDYEQTNEQIRMLTDIRFKLLAFVPTVSTLAISLLGAKGASGTSLVVGILGFITIFAIAMYDLRNSQIYDACISRARHLEELLQMSNFTKGKKGGLYSERPGRTRRLMGLQVWHDRALAYIYGTALGGWFYLVIYSLLSIVSSFFNSPRFLLLNQYIDVVSVVSILIATLVACIFIWQFHSIEAGKAQPQKEPNPA